MSSLISLPTHWEGMPETFVEGALLAANLAPAPLEPETWLPLLVTGGVEEEPMPVVDDTCREVILNHFQTQYVSLVSNGYELPGQLQPVSGEVSENQQNMAEGFLCVWQVIAPMWENVAASDGSFRMLSGLLTTMMLVMDEEGTLEEMQAAGVEPLPPSNQLFEALNMMLCESAMAADEAQHGHGSQSVNPYRDVGRNDDCPCGSGKKFKQCCGQTQ
ncbi:SEC-C metal-binding domain-containing protein [Parasalinivibrio latis]